MNLRTKTLLSMQYSPNETLFSMGWAGLLPDVVHRFVAGLGKRSQAPAGKKVGNVPKPGVHSAKPTRSRKSREEFAEEQEEERGGSSEAPGRVSRSPLGWENGLSARRTPPCFPCFPLHCFRGRAGLMWTPVGRPQPDPPMERDPPQHRHSLTCLQAAGWCQGGRAPLLPLGV